MRVQRVLAYAAFMAVFSAAGLCPGQEEEAGKRFAAEPKADQFLESVKNEVGSWLEGYVGPPGKKQFFFPGHLQFWDRLRPEPDRNGVMQIAWDTAPVPADFTGKTATFAWAAGINPALGEKAFDVSVDGRKRFVIRTRPDASWTVEGPDGGKLIFNGVSTDASNRQFGYMRLVAPIGWLTPGKPLHLSISGAPQDLDSWPRTYPVNETVAWLRTTPRPAVFCRPTFDCDRPGPVTYRVVTRPQWAGRPVALLRGKDVFGQAMLQSSKGISVAAIEVATSRPDMLDGPLTVAVDGRPGGEADGVPLALLTRWQQVAEQVRQGKIGADSAREAAMVLGWGQLMAGMLLEDKERLDRKSVV